MRPGHPTTRLLPLLLGAALFAAAAHAANDDRVIYANSPQDRYEAKVSVLESKIEARRANCDLRESNNRSYCQRELDRELRDSKRELARQFEAELAGKADQ